MVVISYEVDVRFVKLTYFGCDGHHLCQRRRRFDCLIYIYIYIYIYKFAAINVCCKNGQKLKKELLKFVM